MLGGATVTATTVQHAEEMLAQGARGAVQAANAPREGGGRKPRRAAG